MGLKNLNGTNGYRQRLFLAGIRTSVWRWHPSASAPGWSSRLVFELDPNSVAVEQSPFKSIFCSSGVPLSLKVYEGAV